MKVCIKEISGNWNLGVSLDIHTISSTPVGYWPNGRMRFETVRTEIGESLFQLKYREKWEEVGVLAKAVVEHALPYFPGVDLIVPVPASKPRARQPVYEVAQEVSRLAGAEYCDRMLTKLAVSEGGVQIKDLSSKDERINALSKLILLNEVLTAHNPVSILVIDDLYDTGASLEVVCDALRSYPKVGNVGVVTLTRT